MHRECASVCVNSVVFFRHSLLGNNLLSPALVTHLMMWLFRELRQHLQQMKLDRSCYLIESIGWFSPLPCHCKTVEFNPRFDLLLFTALVYVHGVVKVPRIDLMVTVIIYRVGILPQGCYAVWNLLDEVCKWIKSQKFHLSEHFFCFL